MKKETDIIKKIVWWFISIGILVIITHPYFSHWYISHSIILYALTLLPYPLFYFPISMLIKERQRRLKKALKETRNDLFILNQTLKEQKEQIRQVEETTQNECIFYQHHLSKPFEQISPSILKILGYNINFVQSNYGELGMQAWVDKGLDKIQNKTNKETNYFIHLKNAKGEPILFSVKETLSPSKERLYGTLKKQLSKPLLTLKEQKELIAQYQILYDLTDNGILIMNPTSVLDCNSSTLNILGYNKETLIQSNSFFTDFSPEYQPSAYESKELSEQHIRSAYNGEDISFNWTFINSKSNLIDTKIKSKRFLLNDTPTLMLIITKK